MPVTARSGKLPEKIVELVRHGLTEGVVVNRAKRPAKVDRSLLARLTFWIDRLAASATGAVRLAAILTTQPLVPLARVTRASIQTSIFGATVSRSSDTFWD